MQPISASFRDRSGYVYTEEDKIIRTINKVFKKHWDHATVSGLLDKLVANKMIIPFVEQETLPGAWKSFFVERIPFISYPYEWCFSQLKDASFLTLNLQREALDYGMILKDASAFNVQFLGTSAIFIDLLSFEKWEDDAPWKAYKQFCSHFLAPLALSSYTDIQCGCMSRLWIDGIPLPLVSKLLPFRTLFSFRLSWHLHLHAKMQTKHSNIQHSNKNVKNIKVSSDTLNGVVKSLENAIKRLKLKQNNTEWAGYYEDNNYTDSATESKLKFVESVASKVGHDSKLPMAVDLGANTGRYSRCLSPYFEYIIAPDIDPCAVESHYTNLKQSSISNILPLVIDLANVSPALGWACSERDSFSSRCKANFINALALIHHLVITAGIPLNLISNYISEILLPGGYLVIEFVPKEDSQVKRMLSTREDVFDDYTLDGFKNAFASSFNIEDSFQIPETVRTIFIMRRHNS